MSLGKVLITAKSVAGSAEALARLREAGVEVVVRTTPLPCDERWLIEQAHDVDALVFAMEPVSPRLLEAAPRLKIVARPGVGYDTVDIAEATRSGVAVTVAAGTNDQSVADFAFGLLLPPHAASCLPSKACARIAGTASQAPRSGARPSPSSASAASAGRGATWRAASTCACWR